MLNGVTRPAGGKRRPPPIMEAPALAVLAPLGFEEEPASISVLVSVLMRKLQ